jgi:hypothetical protein
MPRACCEAPTVTEAWGERRKEWCLPTPAKPPPCVRQRGWLRPRTVDCVAESAQLRRIKQPCRGGAHSLARRLHTNKADGRKNEEFDTLGVPSLRRPRSSSTVERQIMRAVIVRMFALVGLIGLVMPAQAAPVVRHDSGVSAAPAITMVRQRCGADMKRDASGWQDKHGAWHGGCVNKHKLSSGAPSVAPRGTADELNAQELARVQGAAPPR